MYMRLYAIALTLVLTYKASLCYNISKMDIEHCYNCIKYDTMRCGYIAYSEKDYTYRTNKPLNVHICESHQFEPEDETDYLVWNKEVITFD